MRLQQCVQRRRLSFSVERLRDLAPNRSDRDKRKQTFLLEKHRRKIMSLQQGLFCGTCGKSQQTLDKETSDEPKSLQKCTRCGIVRYHFTRYLTWFDFADFLVKSCRLPFDVLFFAFFHGFSFTLVILDN